MTTFGIIELGYKATLATSELVPLLEFSEFFSSVSFGCANFVVFGIDPQINGNFELIIDLP